MILQQILLGFTIYFVFCLTQQQYNVVHCSSSAAEVEKSKVSSSPVRVVVSFKQNTRHKNIIKKHLQQEFTTREARIQSLYNELSYHANKTHASTVSILSGFPGVTCTSLWITNQLIVENPSAALVKFIKTLDDVLDVEEDRIIPLPETNSVIVPKSNTNADEPQWGIAKIQAPEAWAATNNQNGESIVVAIIDTGVFASHEALTDSFIGDHGWFDPTSLSENPFDDVGHGTHCMGTILGRTNGIGVAPKATWLACKACTPNGCSGTDLAKCGQWVMCPTLPDGESEPDCSKAPHIVSNSWGGGQGDNFYNDIIEAWKAANIMPVFANGNQGPACDSANSPGDQDVTMSVGATNVDDGIADFSSRGQSVDGLIKPDISAPGVDIISASNAGVGEYATLSGTSMATPHVAGVMALLLGSNNDLTYDEIKSHLFDGTEIDGLGNAVACGGIPNDQFPNNVYGNGRLNALNSINLVLGGDPCSASALKMKRKQKKSRHIRVLPEKTA